MSEFKRNVLIKRRREELGMTREELAEGICDVSTLYRFESGRIELKDSTIQDLQEMMDKCGGVYVLSLNDALFIDEEDYYLYEKYLHGREYGKAKSVVENENKLEVEDGTEKTQIIGMINVFAGERNSLFCLDELEKLLGLSVLEYKDGYFPMYRIYNYTELSLLNSIAVMSWNCKNVDKTFRIYGKLMEYFDNAMYNRDNRIYNKIIINYSNYLGLSGRYEKSIAIMKDGLSRLKKNATQDMMYNYIFNVGWILYQLYKENRRREYYDLAKKCVYESYCLCKMFDDPESSISVIEKYYKETFKKG